MQIGIPKETKPYEGRVPLTPAAAGSVVEQGHQVLLETGAGVASGYPDVEYRQAGVEVLPDAMALYAAARLIVKVKEPTPAEYAYLQGHHILFSFLHLAANPMLARMLQDRGVTAVAFETIEEHGRLPVLAPMSEIAGRLAVQIGATLLYAPHGGRGILLGGLPGAERGQVVILGAGAAGGNAAQLAANIGATVTVFERDAQRRDAMHRLGANVTALASDADAIAHAVMQADLLIGAVLIPGGRAPHLVRAEQVARMRPGSVIIDIAVDQGGCIETIRPTDYTAPTYIQDGVIHFGVTNMPGAVPRSASQSLSAVLAPYVLRLAAPEGLEDLASVSGVNVRQGRIVHPAVARALAGAGQR